MTPARGRFGNPRIVPTPTPGVVDGDTRPTPPTSATPTAPTEPAPAPGSYPSEEPGFGEVLSGLFTPPEPTVIPTPYGDSYGAPGGSTALLGLVAVGALGLGGWYLWKRSRA